MEPTILAKEHLWTGEEVHELLDTFVRYKDWKFVVQEEVIIRDAATYETCSKDIVGENYHLYCSMAKGHVGECNPIASDLDIHIRAEWLAPDNVTGAMEKQQSRWWRVSKHMRKNEIINTAFACVRMAEEHEMRENFLYRVADGDSEYWTMPYNTHTDVDELAKASVKIDVRTDTRKSAPKNQRRD